MPDELKISDINPRRFTPQEKKRKRYLKDRRNSYAENDKSSRKAIRFRKKWVNKTYRSNINNKLRNNNDLDLDNSVKSVRKKDWKKSPDIPLIDYVKMQLKHRKERIDGKKLRKKIKLTNSLQNLE